MREYVPKDKKNIIAANPIITTRFGPSGSLEKENSIIEHIIDSIPKIIHRLIFDLKYIFVSISNRASDSSRP
jgi:hypothetical protein